MRLTIESEDSIETVLAVVGTLFKVELAVKSPESSAPAAPTPAASIPAPAAPRGRRRASAPRTAKATAAPADSAAIRSWARANNVAVSPRGRIPASVQAAFEAAQA